MSSHSLRDGAGGNARDGRPGRTLHFPALKPGVALVLALALAGSLSSSCSLRPFASNPVTTGDSPRLNRATSAPTKDVPYCPGGQRDDSCLFGANCRVTNEGCQVCQCLSPGN